MKTGLLSVFLAIIFILSTLSCVYASGISYLPDVTSQMTQPSYWADDDQILMTSDQISEQNRLTIAEKATHMNDLENHAQSVDGIALNQALISSTTADANYYLGWTYIQSDTKATQQEYDQFIANTQNSSALKEQPVKYAVAVNRSELRTFPSEKAIWDSPSDPETDYQFLVSVRVNEPLVITSVSNDKNFYLAKSACCSGWIRATDVAICQDKEQWLSAWKIPSENALVVYGDRVYTEMSKSGHQTSEVLLTMGTVLEMARPENPNVLIDNRAAYQNYAVYLPIRNQDGSYAKKLTLISQNRKVHEGFLPLTQKNIVTVAFEALGNTYGWGGGLNSEDCSSYIRNIYKCFGLELARNTSWQSAMPMAKVSMSNMCREERIKFMDCLPVGSILIFSGHEMLYLGKDNSQYYVISSLGSVVLPDNPSVVQRISSITINTLSVKRKNGKDWLNNLTYAVIPFESKQDNSLPEYSWYNDSVVFCKKNGFMTGDENDFFLPNNNTTWAQFLQIIYNMEGKKQDVEQGQNWYDNAISFAMENNLIHENTSMPNHLEEISREQLVSVLHLYAQFKGYDVSVGPDTNILSYEDSSDVSEYAIAAMQYATGAGIIKGKTPTTLNPKESATRAEIAVIIHRFIEINK